MAQIRDNFGNRIKTMATAMNKQKRLLYSICFTIYYAIASHAAWASALSTTPATPLAPGCTIKFASEFAENGPPIEIGAALAILRNKFGMILKKTDIGDLTKTWIAEQYDLDPETQKRYYPFEAKIIVAKPDIRPDPNENNNRRLIMSIFLNDWVSLCQDSFKETAPLLRQLYGHKNNPDLPGTATTEKWSSQYLTKFTILTFPGSDAIFVFNIEIWEGQ
jgi:hypothetical protein